MWRHNSAADIDTAALLFQQQQQQQQQQGATSDTTSDASEPKSRSRVMTAVSVLANPLKRKRVPSSLGRADSANTLIDTSAAVFANTSTASTSTSPHKWTSCTDVSELASISPRSPRIATDSPSPSSGAAGGIDPIMSSSSSPSPPPAAYPGSPSAQSPRIGSRRDRTAGGSTVATSPRHSQSGGHSVSFSPPPLALSGSGGGGGAGSATTSPRDARLMAQRRADRISIQVDSTLWKKNLVEMEKEMEAIPQLTEEPTFKDARLLREQERKTRNSQMFAHLRDCPDARLPIIEEIVSTERDYVDDLSALISGFLHPLRSANLNVDLASIFSNIELIYTINSDILKRLDERISHATNSSVACTVGDIFLEMSNNLLCYDQYCSNHKKAVETFTRYLQQRPAFATAVQGVMHQLTDFLIKPIQRLCKYPLLFRELLNRTNASHEDFEPLRMALERLEDVVHRVNQRKAVKENTELLIELQKRIDGFPGKLNEPGRYYLHQGFMEKINPKGKVQSRYFFLFSDMLVWCKVKNLKKQLYVFKGSIFLARCVIRQPQDNFGYRTLFQIIKLETKKIYNLIPPNAKEKAVWVSFLEGLIDSYLELARLAPNDTPKIESSNTERQMSMRSITSSEVKALQNSSSSSSAAVAAVLGLAKEELHSDISPAKPATTKATDTSSPRTNEEPKSPSTSTTTADATVVSAMKQEIHELANKVAASEAARSHLESRVQALEQLVEQMRQLLNLPQPQLVDVAPRAAPECIVDGTPEQSTSPIAADSPRTTDDAPAAHQPSPPAEVALMDEPTATQSSLKVSHDSDNDNDDDYDEEYASDSSSGDEWDVPHREASS